MIRTADGWDGNRSGPARDAMTNSPGHPPRGIVLAAPASGCGKTTLTLALLRALSRRHAGIVAGKSGPDYIDPQYHAYACGNSSMTLDAWAMSDAQLRSQLVSVHAKEASLVLVEGAMGLFDGAGMTGKGSTAELANRLGLPVVLVIDVGQTSHSAAIYHLGALAIMPDLDIRGVIANRVASSRHLSMVRGAIEATGMNFLGWMPRDETLGLPSRHLGLLLASEHPSLDDLLNRLADQAEETLKISTLESCMGALPPMIESSFARVMEPLGQSIAVAEDDAFSFIYPHLLTSWLMQGASIGKFSPLRDEAPADDADAVFLPGGYPELHAETLANATCFHRGMEAARSRGALIYGECGGYMVLGRHIRCRDGNYPMLGFLPHSTDMTSPRRQLGYRILDSLPRSPVEGCFSGHEFHYSTETPCNSSTGLFNSTDADGQDLGTIGISLGNVCGSYAHVICTRTTG